MNALKEQLEASARGTVDKAQEVIRCAQELHQESRISASVLTEAVKLCEAGLPFVAERDLQTVLVRSLLDELYSDLPDPSLPYTY